MFATMSLARKLSLVFGSFIALLLCFGAFFFYEMGAMNQSIDEVANDGLPTMKAASTVSDAFQSMRRSQVRLLIYDSDEARADTIKELEKRIGKVEEADAAYTPRINTPEERALHDEFRKLWEQYLQEHKKTLELLKAGKLEQARDFVSGANLKNFGVTKAAIDKLVLNNEEDAAKSAAAGQASYRRARLLGTVVLAFATLMGIAVAIWLTRGVMSQLGEDPGYLAEVAGKIAGGDLNVVFRPQKKAGGVYAVMQDMVNTMKARIDEAQQSCTMADEKSKEAEIATKEALEAKAQAERAKAEGMMAAATQLEKVVEIVSSASEELSAQIEQSSRGTEVQSQRVGETATAMEEMNATVLEVAKNASQAADSSGNAREKALDGAKIVAQVVAGINTMQTVSLTMKEDMGVLGKQADGIGQIMNVISDIADQTNLLALNAAIEAARAGDAGRGFAVVADEVRKLAEKTQTATKEVGEAISGIQKGTKKNLENVDRAVTTVEQATELANKSGEALQEIVRLVEVSTDQVRSIATASEEQSAASEEINRSIEEINRISSETASAMNQSAQAVGELATQAGALRTLIEKMKSGG